MTFSHLKQKLILIINNFSLSASVQNVGKALKIEILVGMGMLKMCMPVTQRKSKPQQIAVFSLSCGNQ